MATPGTTPSKRRKHVKTAAGTDHEMLEEVPEAMEEDDDLVIASQVAVETEAGDTIQVAQSQVHFDDEEENHEGDVSIHVNFEEKSTATHITPHPNKTSNKRRVTASPFVNGGIHDAKHHKYRTTRHSLPPTLSQEPGESYTSVEELEFAPLSQLVSERAIWRKQVYQLHEELVVEKREGNSAKVKQLEEELTALLRVHRPTLAAGDFADVDMLLDEDMLVLASQQEVTYPDLPAGSSQLHDEESPANKLALSGRLSLSQSQYRSKEDEWDEERKKFQDVITTLSDEAQKATTKLHVLEIQVTSLGFGHDGMDANAVLASIRRSFINVQETMQAVLPDSLPDNASNEAILEVTAANVTEFADRLRIADRELQEKAHTAAQLRDQIQGLVDHLAEAKVRYGRLHEKWQALDQANEGKERENEELLESLQQAEDDRDAVHDELEAKKKEFDLLKNENTDFAKSIDRLTASLQQYRDEETRLQELVAKMETDHKTTVSSMNKEREETVRDLEDRLDTQSQARAQAEQSAEDRQRIIDGLQTRVMELEPERDQLRQQLVDMTDDRDEQRDAREAAEAEALQKDEHIAGLEARLDNLDAELSDLNDQLDELRRINETERAQREELETELDAREAEAKELDEKLHSKGTEANELRQKIFEIQQKNEKHIEDLNKAASERDEQYQKDISEEVARREEAEELAHERERTIDDLEARLEEVEAEMRAALADSDGRVAELEDQVAEKEGELEQLRETLEATETEKDKAIAEGEQQAQALQTRITELDATIEKLKETIASMQQEAESAASLHDSEIEDRDSRIAALNHDVVRLQDEVAQLQKNKESLERRVNDEAEQYLTMQNEKDAEIDSLKTQLKEKQDNIEVVLHKHKAAENAWQETLDEKEKAIMTLQQEADDQYSAVTSLKTNMASMKRLMEQFVEKSNAKMEAIREDRRIELEKMNNDVEEHANEGEDTLRQLDELTVWEEQIHEEHVVLGASQKSQSRPMQTRGRKKRGRNMDSGVGMDDETLLESTMLLE